MLNVVSTVRTYATPVCSIHDISESLASDLLARFPAALNVEVNFHPDIRKNFNIENFITAECVFIKVNPRTKCFTAEQDNIYDVTSEWHLPSSPQLGFVVSLVLRTREHTVSTVYDRNLDLRTTRSRSSLKHVHPTFGLHEEVARFAEQLQSDSAEGAALLLAQCLFHLADKQSPCKRLQHVHIAMKEVAPLMEGSRSRREALVERVKKEFDNDYATACSVHLGRQQYEQSQRSLLSSDVRKGRHRAYLALGSNLGNRVEMIESAIREMSERGLTVLRTSALYETKPMYLENQETFINGTCEVCSTDAAANSRPGNVDMARLKHR